jgi:GDP-4-dehydro-6-deoxy-D-mannose reductase
LSPRRDFLHVADAVSAYRVLIEHGEHGGAYNLASGQAWSIGEALDRLRAISGVAVEVERDERRLRPVNVPLLVGDNQRLRALGWAPRHDLDQALRDLWLDAGA